MKDYPCRLCRDGKLSYCLDCEAGRANDQMALARKMERCRLHRYPFRCPNCDYGDEEAHCLCFSECGERGPLGQECTRIYSHTSAHDWENCECKR